MIKQISFLIFLIILNPIDCQILQSEYSSYESSPSEDFVDLLTGDMCYSLPLISLDGYDLMLSYHSGIKPDDDASWTGLGWSINPGCIIRNVNSIPDDYSGQEISNRLMSDGVWGSVYTITPSHKISTNSEKAKLVEADWHLFKFGFSKDKDQEYVKFTEIRIDDISETDWGDVAVEQITLILKALSYYFGAGGTWEALGFSNEVANALTEIYSYYEIGQKIYNGYSFVSGLQDLSSSLNYLRRHDNWVEKNKTRIRFYPVTLIGFQNDWSYSLNMGVDEQSYGPLWFGQYNDELMDSVRLENNLKSLKSFLKKVLMPWTELEKIDPDKLSVKVTEAIEYIQDVIDEDGNQSYEVEDRTQPIAFFGDTGQYTTRYDHALYIDEGGYAYSMNPCNIAYDNYQVMGPGISGLIQPYRPDVGSLSTAYLGGTGSSYTALNPKSFFTENYHQKVPFRYKGSIGNSYNFHLGQEKSIPANEVDALNQFRFDYEYDSEKRTLTFKNDDSGLISTIPFDSTKYGDNQIYAARRILYYTNHEIASNRFLEDGIFMDYCPNDFNRSQSRVHEDDRTYTYGIGGFSITREDGMTYHYALPIYNRKEYHLTIMAPEGTAEIKSERTNENAYAITWLLTGITGPNFIDNPENANGKGFIDESDFGYWIKFEYGRFCSNYTKRIPEAGSYWVDETTTGISEYEFEKYYLDQIITSTHNVLFIKSLRDDGTSVEGNRSLKLNEICILTKDHYNYLVNELGFSLTNLTSENEILVKDDSFDKIIDDFNIKPTIRTYLNKNCVKIIKFDYNYDLCKNVPTNINQSPNLGKLTLKKIEHYGKNSMLISPPLTFDYSADNPSFKFGHYDGWGYYNTELNDRIPKYSATPWLLSKLNLPDGASISIEYERDRYSYVCGNTMKQIEYLVKSDKSAYNLMLKLPLKFKDEFSIGKSFKVYFFGFPIPIDDLTIKEITTSGDYISAYFNCSQDIPLSRWKAYTYVNKTWYGGDIRVKKIITKGDNFESTKEILYQNGFCTSEPPACRNPFEFYDIPKKTQLAVFPVTPIMYQNVIVENSWKNSNQLHRIEYEFNSPSSEIVQCLVGSKYPGEKLNDDNYVKMMNFIVKDFSSQIGAIQKIDEYINNEKLCSQIFNYKTLLNNNQGVYTDGVIASERINYGNKDYWRLMRTTNIEFPYILEKTELITNKAKYETEYTQRDFLTGAPHTTITKNYTNDKYFKQVSIPAYKFYPEMDVYNNHLLSQIAVNASYEYNKIGLTPDEIDFQNINNWNGIDAEIQTWKADWDIFENSSSSDINNWSISSSKNWLKHKLYNYDGTRDIDGYATNLILPSQNSNIWQGEINENNDLIDDKWLKILEITKYDKNSQPVEIIDLNGNYTATLFCTKHKTKVLASGVNTSSDNFIFVNFEEQDDTQFSDKYYFGEGITCYKHNNFIDLNKKHTGECSIRIGPETFGPTFSKEITLANKNVLAGKTYIASVWVHNNSDPKAILCAQGYNGLDFWHSKSIIQSDFVAGEWSLINLIFSLPNTLTEGSFFKVFLWNTNGTKDAWFDDFKIQPINSKVTGYIYNDWGQLSSMVNNNNIATKYEYNNSGDLSAVYKETEKGFEIVSSHSKNFEKMPFTVSTSYISFAPEGSEKAITIETPYGWQISKPEWINIPTTGNPGKTTIWATTNANVGFNQKTDKIVITSQNGERSINVYQKGLYEIKYFSLAECYFGDVHVYYGFRNRTSNDVTFTFRIDIYEDSEIVKSYNMQLLVPAFSVKEEELEIDEKIFNSVSEGDIQGVITVTPENFSKTISLKKL